MGTAEILVGSPSIAVITDGVGTENIFALAEHTDVVVSKKIALFIAQTQPTCWVERRDCSREALSITG